MKTHTPHIKLPYLIALTAASILIALTTNTTLAQTADSLDQSGFPQITAQPVDQCIPIGGNVVLSVEANNADGYQWLRNGVAVAGQTNSSLAIVKAKISDVGLYSCDVSLSGGGTVPTRTANVTVYVVGSSTPTVSPKLAASSLSVNTASSKSMPGGGPITVFGTPFSGGGSQGGCPGTFAGYVLYTKPVSQGWGYSPSGSVHSVADGSGRTDTKIQYCGAYGDNGCNQTSVSIPNPTYSPVYQFAIYFPNNVPTNAYPITMTGFNP